MKLQSHLVFLAFALGGTTAHAVTTLAEETFTRTDGSVVRNTAVSPIAGPANWGGSPGYTALNNALASVTTGSGHVLTIDFGVDYFVDNPGLYTITADVFFQSNALADASTKNWQIGFNNASSLSAGANRSLLSNDTYGGAPGLILRADGAALAKTVNTTTASTVAAAGTYAAGSVYSLKLVLDTQPTSWTVDAYIDNVALDINGASIGTTFTYATNPTIRYITIGSNLNATDNTNFSNYLDNFKVTVDTVPEPATWAALAGLAVLGLAIVRRRR